MPRATESSVPPTEAGFQKVYVVLETTRDPCGSGETATEVNSVYISEEQAYAAAIRKQIAHLENVWGLFQKTETEGMSEIRSLVTEKWASSKDKFESMEECMSEVESLQNSDEYVSYGVQSCRVEPLEKANVDDALDEDDDEDEEGEEETEEDDTDDDGASTKNGNGTASGKKRRRETLGLFL